MSEKTLARWEVQSEVQNASEVHTEQDAWMAAVHTRLDTALNAHIGSYSAQTLVSIKYGVWALAALELADLIFTHVHL